MDGPGLDPVELAENFRDIRRVNRLLGGISTVTHHLTPMLPNNPSERPVTVLDLATGSADIPLALLDWGEHRGIRFDITASDVSDDMLAIARKHVGDRAGIILARHDARAVPLPDRSFDIVLCSLSLHHFDPDDAVELLREMNRLATAGCIVNDLTRSRTGYFAAAVAARVTTRNRLTRNDAPLSVLRAYTPDELRAMLRYAGIRDPLVCRHRWFRMAATWESIPNG
jgi:ubiquinone/menaquinone biosynthesis C-methylase UbiE